MSKKIIIIAGPSGAGATVKGSLTAQSEPRGVRTTEESSVVQPGRNEEHRLSGGGIDRDFSLRKIVSTGYLGRRPRLVWRWAFGSEAQTAPSTHYHTNLTPAP
jgi:hypothetical protein